MSPSLKTIPSNSSQEHLYDPSALTEPPNMSASEPHGNYESGDHSGEASASNCIISPRGLFRVFRYHSFEGYGGMPVTIPVNFTLRPSERTYLRIVIGRRALNTTVRQLPKLGVWELEAVVPHLDELVHGQQSAVVPIVAQALTDTEGVLDDVTVGSYTYWFSDHPSMGAPEVKAIRRTTALQSRQDFISPHMHRSQSYPDVNRPHSSSSSHASPHVHRARTAAARTSNSRSRSGRTVDSLRLAKKQALMRTRRFGPGEEYPESHRAVLEIINPVDTMCTGWDEDELKVGRRLVRFTRNQEGFRLKLICESIKQEDYTDGDTVISCIYRRDSDTCYVTSVDIIFLLESIVGEAFEIEEKNRIRRNLEGFRPKTVSKNRAGSETFFQQIMDFPAPKPRNIEKDVKVFEWSILPQALEKIISKYSLYYSSDNTESGHSPSPSASELVGFTSSPVPHARFPSPPSSVPELASDSSVDDHFVYTPETTYPARMPHGMPMPYPASEASVSSYGSLLDNSPLSTLTPPSGGHRTEAEPTSFHPVYRLMPSQTSSMSDISIPSAGMYPPADGYYPHRGEHRITSPVPFY